MYGKIVEKVQQRLFFMKGINNEGEWKEKNTVNCVLMQITSLTWTSGGFTMCLGAI